MISNQESIRAFTEVNETKGESTEKIGVPHFACSLRSFIQMTRGVNDVTLHTSARNCTRQE